jgi:hypothetical protein
LLPAWIETNKKTNEKYPIPETHQCLETSVDAAYRFVCIDGCSPSF